MQMKTDEKSKKEEDALINFSSLVISKKFNLWMKLQKNSKILLFHNQGLVLYK
jgi:hypothetical protein